MLTVSPEASTAQKPYFTSRPEIIPQKIGNKKKILTNPSGANQNTADVVTVFKGFIKISLNNRHHLYHRLAIPDKKKNKASF